MLLFVSVFVILFTCKKNCLLTEKFRGYTFKIGNFWCCYQTIFGVEYKLRQQSVLENVCTVEIKYWVWTTT